MMHQSLLLLEKSLNNPYHNNAPIIERCISLISSAIKDTSKATQGQILPIAINLCISLHDMHSHSMSLGEIRALYYELIFNILLIHWRFFVGSRIQAASQVHIEEFKKLFEA